MGLIVMSERDLQRIEVLSKVVEGRTTIVSAAHLLALSPAVGSKLKYPEELAKRHGIDLGVETIQRWRLAEAIQTFFEATLGRRVLAPDARRLQSAFLHRTASWAWYPAPVLSSMSEAR
jgi:hypothetical protein